MFRVSPDINFKNKKVFKYVGFNTTMLIDRRRVILTEAGKKCLKELRLKKGLPLKFKQRYGTIVHWENGRGSPTVNLFKEYLNEFSLSLDDFHINMLIKEIALPSQQLATMKGTKIPIEEHASIIKDYNSGLTLDEISRKYNCHFVTIFYILKKYNIDTSKHGSGENYHFPESNYIAHLQKLNLPPPCALPLLASLLFTDGCLCKTKKTCEITYYGYDQTLHKIFSDLVWYYFKIKPSSYMVRCGRVFKTKYINKTVINKMLELSPTYKTKPAPKQNWSDFLKEVNKPSLNFLKNYDLKILKEFIRLAMCADGCIAVSRKKNSIFFTLLLACSHPSLVEEWSKLFFSCGIKNNIVKGSGKTGLGGVKGVEDCLFKFNELGGFIEGVEVCVRRSPLCGITKQKILSKAVELLKEQRKINTLKMEFNNFKRGL